MRHGLLQVHALGDGFFGRVEQGGDKVAGVGKAFSHGFRGQQRRTTAGHDFFSAHGGQHVQRGRPLFELRVAGVASGIGFDQVAREQHFFRRHPHHRVATGVASAGVHDFDFELAHPQGHLVLEHQGRPRQAGDGVKVVEQARKALVLGLHVLRAALDNHFVSALAGNDFLHASVFVARSAQHAHRVVVRQHHVFDGLVSHFTNFGDQALRHHRRGQCIANQHRVVANDDAGVRVALGGVGPAVVRQLNESGFFDLKVSDGSEVASAHGESPVWIDGWMIGQS